MAEAKNNYLQVAVAPQFNGHCEVLLGGTTAIQAVDLNGEVHTLYVSAPADENKATDAWWWKFNMSFLVSMLTSISGKQSTVLKTVLENIDSYNNLLITTQGEVALKAKASRLTVGRVFEMLEEHEIIRKQQQGVYVVNPRFLSQGGKRKYEILQKQWDKAGADNKLANDQRKNPLLVSATIEDGDDDGKRPLKE